MHSLNPLKNNRCFGININGLLTSAGTANWQKAASARANSTEEKEMTNADCLHIYRRRQLTGIWGGWNNETDAV